MPGAWGLGGLPSIATLPTQLPTDPSLLEIGTGGFPSNIDSFVGGGQIGYNYQWSTGLVLGLEADLQGFTGKSSGAQGSLAYDTYFSCITELGALRASKQLDYLGTVRARIGYPVAAGLLPYFTGGLAYGHASFSTALFGVAYAPDGTALASATSAANYSDTRVGWSAGAGLELMTFPNWSARFEYLYYDLGSVTKVSPIFNSWTGFNTPAVAQSSVRFYGNIARLGLSYHFNNATPPAPVVAKY